MNNRQWMIYGANGYTGELIAREAAKRGSKPVLAGRSAGKIEPLAAELGLEGRIFSLTDPQTTRQGLSGIELLVHCAGPFSATAKPMLEACLVSRTHYLDITGEIDVFDYAHSLHQRAVDAGIVVCPGAGFDVVPTDCLAAALSGRRRYSHVALVVQRPSLRCWRRSMSGSIPTRSRSPMMAARHMLPLRAPTRS